MDGFMWVQFQSTTTIQAQTSTVWTKEYSSKDTDLDVSRHDSFAQAIPDDCGSESDSEPIVNAGRADGAVTSDTRESRFVATGKPE